MSNVNLDAVKAATAELAKAQSALNRFEEKIEEKHEALKAAKEAARQKLLAVLGGETVEQVPAEEAESQPEAV